MPAKAEADLLRDMVYAKVAAALSFLVCAGAFAQDAHTPQPGTPERAAIMDALRVAAQKDLGRAVIFKVDALRMAGDWAYARVSPTTPNGEEIDYSKTKFRKQVELGAFDPQGEALLRREGDRWKILEWVFGATDVTSVTWGDRYRFPKSILDG
ncbi:MAG: hypothetical protein ABR526_00815 [Chthoniobacterales bacterium]